MKRILVACACAAGLLLVLSSSCDDDDFTGPAGKTRGCSGNPVQQFVFTCGATSGGTSTGNCYLSGVPIAWFTTNDYCHTTSTSYCFNPPGACFRVSGGIVTISFGMDPFSGLSIEFLVAEADVKAATGTLDVGTAVVAGTSVVFKAQKTGRCISKYDTSLCFFPNVNINNTLAIDAWNDNPDGTPDTVLGPGDTIDITWDETRAHEVEDAGQCDTRRPVLTCGVTTGIPYA